MNLAPIVSIILIVLRLYGPCDFSGYATYYHDMFAGRLTRSEEVFRQDSNILAVDDTQWKTLRGKHLLVCRKAQIPHASRQCVVGRVEDTGYLGRDNVDLSKALFLGLGPLEAGVFGVDVWILGLNKGEER